MLRVRRAACERQYGLQTAAAGRDTEIAADETPELATAVKKRGTETPR